MSKEDILKCFQGDEVICESLSWDSISNTINTLRKIGCEISRPTAKTNYCYVLVSHPFTFSFTNENIEALQAIRNSITTLGDWELLLHLNELYKKLANYTSDKNTKEVLLYNHKLKNINLNFLKELLNNIALKKQINIQYDSPQKGSENIDFRPEYITFESDKLYLWGYILKHDCLSYLRVDRITKINFVRINTPKEEICNEKKEVSEITYELKGLSAIMYLGNEDEEIVSESVEEGFSIIIRANVMNKFNFFQRILSYGTDCKIVSPESAVAELKDILKRIKAVYTDEN